MPQGIAVSIGLNAVDPDQYGGWSGELNACEADAQDMAAIAAAQGFAGETLLTNGATRGSVLAAIQAAAARLTAGDIFLLTYSGHGGQLPDLNGDEDDDQDETWCLYDGQIVDDELNELYAKFAAGSADSDLLRQLPQRHGGQGGLPQRRAQRLSAGRHARQPRLSLHASQRRAKNVSRASGLLRPLAQQAPPRWPGQPGEGLAAIAVRMSGQPVFGRRRVQRAVHRPRVEHLAQRNLQAGLPRVSPRDRAPHAAGTNAQPVLRRKLQRRLRPTAAVYDLIRTAAAGGPSASSPPPPTQGRERPLSRRLVQSCRRRASRNRNTLSPAATPSR